MSDVEAGGGTVFTQVGTTLFPSKVRQEGCLDCHAMPPLRDAFAFLDDTRDEPLLFEAGWKLPKKFMHNKNCSKQIE